MALAGLIVNLVVTVVLTLVFNAAGIARGEDRTRPDDYLTTAPAPTGQ